MLVIKETTVNLFWSLSFTMTVFVLLHTDTSWKIQTAKMARACHAELAVMKPTSLILAFDLDSQLPWWPCPYPRIRQFCIVGCWKTGASTGRRWHTSSKHLTVRKKIAREKHTPGIQNVRFTSLPADHRQIPLAVVERPPLSSPLLTWRCRPLPEWFRCPHTPLCLWHTASLHTHNHMGYIGHDIQGLADFCRCKISISWKVWPFPLRTKSTEQNSSLADFVLWRPRYKKKDYPEKQPPRWETKPLSETFPFTFLCKMNFLPQLQALVYNSLPPTAAIVGYTLGLLGSQSKLNSI